MRPAFGRVFARPRAAAQALGPALGLLLPGGAAAAQDLAALQEIPVHAGVNTVPGFAPDGRTASLVKGWRDNGNAHGFWIYLVLLPLDPREFGPGPSSGVTPFQDDPSAALEPTIGASPFDGERVTSTVRFARTRIGGAAASVAIRADLGPSRSGVLADHAPVRIRIYRLEHPGTAVGSTPDLFRLIRSREAPGPFCNADMALQTLMGLPVPEDYAGGPAPSGC